MKCATARSSTCCSRRRPASAADVGVRFLAVGHCARDEFPDGAWRIGGTALYAAAAAARLGVPTALVTRVGPGERDELARVCRDLAIELHALPSQVTTTFVFRWDQRGRRILRLRARARGISLAEVPGAVRAAPATVLGSIAQELAPDLFFGSAASGIRVLAAQGHLRAWDAEGTVRPSPWPDAEERIRGLSCVVLSEEDVGSDADLPARWSRAAPVALTLAERGARLYQGGVAVAEAPAFAPARIVDATGAGDTFAAGLAVALTEGRDLLSGMRLANAVASFCLEGPGVSGLGTRADVERRLGA